MDKQRFYEIGEKWFDRLDGRFKTLSSGLHKVWSEVRKRWHYYRLFRSSEELQLLKPLNDMINGKKDLSSKEKRIERKSIKLLKRMMASRVIIDKLEGGDGFSWTSGMLLEAEERMNKAVLNKLLSLSLESSSEVIGIFAAMKGAVQRGKWPGRFVYVPGDRTDRVLLVAHADTVWDDRSADPVANKFVEENGIYRPSGLIPLRGLGADDRAGCALLWALRDMGHSLLITDGEERGRLGSRFLMEDPANRDIARDINKAHGFAVQFDRRNGRDFKCYEVGTDEFRGYVARETGYTEPDRSSFTDLTILCRRIPGVNLSIGFYNEHTAQEYLVFEEWMNTLNVAKKWLSGPMPRFSLHKTASAVRVA